MTTAAQNSPITGILFSKDRALQLDGTLRSFKLHCQDPHLVEINILYTTSEKKHLEQYQKVIEEYPEFTFIQENTFHEDVLQICGSSRYLLFLVDDNIFVRPFSLDEIINKLEQHTNTLAFSLRLGENNTYFYMADCPQNVPHFKETANPAIFSFDWTKAEYDFAFPIEVSSSIYRTSDLWPFLSRIEFTSPNSLEFNLSQFRHRFRDITPQVLCYRQSRTFCNPINIVNTVCRCRAGSRQEYTSASLSLLFEKGFRIDVNQYRDFSPTACHQEVELKLCKDERLKQNNQTRKFTEFIRNDSDAPLTKARKLKKLFLQKNLKTDAEKVYDAHLRNHPEDSDLVAALTYWDDLPTETNLKIPTISIIIPAYNCDNTIIDSLDSIQTSLDFCRDIIPNINFPEWSEIVVVNDNSSDNTAAVVSNYRAQSRTITIYNNPINMGAGPTRNLGVRHAKNDLIFFLDGDDLFFREHIFLCVHSFITKPWIHFVQTGIRIDEKILPYWKRSIENSVPFNLCVRRWCHECIGGFPEDKAFQSMRCEDAFYRILLTRYFIAYKLKRETIHHFRYPGNALDRQLEKFSHPPTKTCSEEVMTEEELAVFPEIKRLLAIKTAQLERNFKAWKKRLEE